MKVVTASDLKRYTADIINTVFYKKTPILIKRHDKVMVKIIPAEKERESRKKDIKSLLDKYWGVAPKFPEVINYRRNRKWKDIFD